MNLGRQRGRKGRQLGCLSNSCHWVIRGGGSWIGVCQENLCPDVRESVPCLTYGFLPVAGAGRLCGCSVEGRGCISVICKHMGVGVEVGVLSGCSQQGITPASPHRRIKTGISPKLISYHLILSQGPQLPSLSPQGKCSVWVRSKTLQGGLHALSTPPPRNPFSNTEGIWAFPLGSFPPVPPSPRKGLRVRRVVFNPSSTTRSPDDLCIGYLTFLNLVPHL